MTGAVIIWVWGLVFFFAAVPGAALGWTLGALFGSAAGVAFSLLVSVIAGTTAAEKVYPGSLNAISAGAFNATYYPLFFVPPILAALLLGVWISSLTSKVR
jgi:hypothetical protein